MRKEKKYSIWTKMIAVMLTVISVFSLFSVIPVSALNFNGESLINGGGHYTPSNTSGYSVPSNASDQIKGYRFAIVQSNGDVFFDKYIGVKTVDVYRSDLSDEADGRTRYKVKNKMCKAEIVELYKNNDIGEIEFTRRTSGTYYGINSGTAGTGEIKFLTALPKPVNGDLAGPVNAWQSLGENLLPIVQKIMGDNKKLSDLPIGSVITIEPIYGLKLEGKQCSMTATEIALYGAAAFGRDSNGGKSSESGKWGFIADYTNRVYPNGLYTADSTRLNGMWKVVTNIKTTRYDQYTFDTIIKYGYGVGIAYANMPTIKIVYRSVDSGSTISSAKSGTYYLGTWNSTSNCVKNKSSKTVYTTVFNPGDKKTLENPSSKFGLTRTGYTLVTSSYKFYGKKVNVGTEHTYNYYLNIAQVNDIKVNSNGSIVLIANVRWTPSVIYSVSVDPNGGSWTYGGKTYKSEHELGEVSFNVSKSGVTNVTLGTPTRIGYIHDEWNCMRIDANGTETWYGTKSGVDGLSWYLKSDVSNFQNFTNSVGKSGKITDEWIKRSSGGTLSKSADYVQTATWTPITYKVRFHGNGFTSGSMSDQSHTYDSSKKLTKNAFEREFTVTYNYNYTGCPKDSVVSAPSEFDGWAKTATGNVVYANTQKVKNLENTQNAVHNVYAKWDDSSVILPTPTREGYKFDGWYTAASGGTKIGNGGAEFTPASRIKNPDSADTRLTTTNVTLYAHWTPYKLTVRYNSNGGSVPSTIKNSNNETRYQKLDSSGNIIRKSSAIVSTDKAFTQTAKYNEDINLYNGSTFGLTKVGYEFDGWNTKADKTGTTFDEDKDYKATDIASNLTTSDCEITLYAKWKPITYKVRFHGNNFTSGSMSDQSHTYDSSKNLTQNAFKRIFTVTYNYNYTGCPDNSVVSVSSDFSGWAKTATGSVVYTNTQSVKNLENTQNAVHNVYAKWKDNSVILPTPTRVGYTFDGWYTSADGNTKKGDGGETFTPANEFSSAANADTPLSSTNVTLYAHWTPSAMYTVSVDPNGGSWTYNKKTYTSKYKLGEVSRDVEKAGVTDVTLGTPTRIGHKFLEWNCMRTDVLGRERWYGQNSAGDTNWFPKEDVTNFIKFENSVGNSKKINDIWLKRFDGGFLTKGADFVQIATWAPNILKIRYNANSGSVPSTITNNNNEIRYQKLDSSGNIIRKSTSIVSTDKAFVQTAEYDENVDLFNDTTFGLTKSGYVFVGWDTQEDGNGTNFDPHKVYKATDIASDLTTSDCEITLYAKWVPNSVEVNVLKDGKAMDNTFSANVKLYQNGTLKYSLTKQTSDTYVGSAIPAGTYDIWADNYNHKSVDTGVDIVISNSSNTATINYYTLTLNKGAGIEKVNGNSGIYLNGETAIVNAPSVINGYHFVNWTGTKKVNTTTFTTAMSSKQTYTANAEANVYTITYKWSDDTVIATDTYTYGAGKSELLSQSDIKGYIITPADSKTWSTTPDCNDTVTAIGATETGDKIFYKNKEEKEPDIYTITYKWSDGTVIAVEQYTEGTEKTLLSQSNVEGYTITPTDNTTWSTTPSCSDNVSKIEKTDTGDKIFYKKKEANVYTITYKWSDDTVITTDTYTYGAGKSELLSQRDIEGYIITPADNKTWSTTPDCNDTVTAISVTETGDKIFYKMKEAKEPDIYTITYKWSDGTVIDTDSYKQGEGKATLRAQTAPTGYSVTPEEGKTWSTNSDCTDSVTTISSTETGDKVFYKKKTAKVYNITYKWSDGTIIAKDTYTYGIGKSSLRSQVAPEGYSVIPAASRTWSTNSDCTDSVTAISSTETGDKVFYKKKTGNVYNITYKWSDGTIIAKDTYTYGIGKSSLRSQVAPEGYLVTPSANTTWSTTIDCTDKKKSIESTEKCIITLYKKKTSVSVTINVLKDEENWIDSGKNIILYKNGIAKYSLSPVTGTNKYTAKTVIIGTYDIYATGYNGKAIDTGIDLVVANSSNTATVNYYTLTLKAGEGIEKVNGNSGVYLNGETATIKSPTVITGYRFVEWYGTETKTTTSFTTVMNKTKEYKARAKVSQFSITYHIIDKNGNINDIATDTYVSGVEKQLIDVPDEAINTGYKITAIGWYENSDCTGNTVSKIKTTDTGDKHFYIKEEPIVYKLVFHGNTATGGTMDPQYITYDNLPTTLNNNKFVKEYNVKYNYVDGTGTVIKTEIKSANATFEGWTVGVAKSPSTVKKTVDYVNMDTINTNLSSTDNDVINLYAVWTLYTETLPEVDESDIPDGYEPEGWDPEGDEIIDPLPPGTKIPVAEDIEFTEVITPIIYHIEYKVDGEIVDTVDYTIEDTIIIKELPEDDTKDFSLWTVTFAEGNWQHGYTFVPDENTGKGHYGNVIIETNSTEKEDLDIYLSPIIPNALYRENTDVITSYYIVNDSTSDICNIDDDFVVSFRVYNGSSVNADESNLIYANTFTNIVCPSALTTATNNKNLIWFKWSVPEGIESNCVTIVAVLKNRVTGKEYPLKDMTTQVIYSDNTRIYNTQPYEIMTAENPENLLAIENGQVSYTKPPEGYTIPKAPQSSKDMMEWMVWEYDTTEGWIQKNYSAGISSKTPVISCTAQTAEYKNGYWYTKGGYGLTISLTNTNTANNASEKPLDSMYTSSQYAYAVFPEFYYAASDGSASTLELIDGKWVFRVNEGSASKARAHYIPTWFTSGTENLEGVNYIISVTQSDMWTPMGMCQKTSNGNTIKVADICFNDIY